MPRRSLTVVDVTNQTNYAAATRSAHKAATRKNARKSSATKAKPTAAQKPASPRSTPKTPARSKQKVASRSTKGSAARSTPKKTESKRVEKEPRSVKRGPLGHLLIEKLLREASFRGGISSDKKYLDRYATDESIFSVRPQIVIQPKDARDVETAVSVIAKNTGQYPSLSLTPRAAGTGLSGGSLTDSIVIDVCSHMRAIGPVAKRKGVPLLTCEPGAMWRDVEKVLKRDGYYLPPYPASKDLCSIGGSVANDAAGPDSLRYGSCADWVESLEVVLYDGKTYTIEPMSYKEYRALIKQDTAYAKIAEAVFKLIEKHSDTIAKAKPQCQKNTAGYQLWDVLDVTPAQFKRGKGRFDLTRLISGSQGSVGIITNITLRAEPIRTDTEMIVIPVFSLKDTPDIVVKALAYNPVNLEVFDGQSFDLALRNPTFFKSRLSGMDYYRVLLSMYTTYHISYGRRLPELTLLLTIDRSELKKHPMGAIIKDLSSRGGTRARHVQNKIEQEMYWQIRRASYSLAKLLDPEKRPAAFLEDMVVPPKNLARFFTSVKHLLKEYNLKAAVHGHGGNGHFHFYPLLDFTQKTTGKLVEKIADEFFTLARKYDGTICGEHNDGIIRTPDLHKVYDQKTLKLFKEVERCFDPNDIFNPGKKVNPRFDITGTIRTSNTL